MRPQLLSSALQELQIVQQGHYEVMELSQWAEVCVSCCTLPKVLLLKNKLHAGSSCGRVGLRTGGGEATASGPSSHIALWQAGLLYGLRRECFFYLMRPGIAAKALLIYISFLAITHADVQLPHLNLCNC